MITPIVAGDIGKRKIPKYLYHLTKSKNIPNIKSQGLKMGFDEFFGNGVFLFEMPNLIKFWKARFRASSLQQKLLEYTSDRVDELTLLRIPTKNIDKSELMVRRQDLLFKLALKYDNSSEIYRAYKRGEISEFVYNHIYDGVPAVWSHKLNGKKTPLEYIYPDKIAPDCFEIIGRGNVPAGKIDFISTMKEIVKGQPEEKMLDAFA